MLFLQFLSMYSVHAETFIATTNIKNLENNVGLTPNQEGLYPNPLKPLLNLYKPFSIFKMCEKCDFYAKKLNFSRFCTRFSHDLGHVWMFHQYQKFWEQCWFDPQPKGVTPKPP